MNEDIYKATGERFRQIYEENEKATADTKIVVGGIYENEHCVILIIRPAVGYKNDPMQDSYHYLTGKSKQLGGNLWGYISHIDLITQYRYLGKSTQDVQKLFEISKESEAE